MSWEFPPATGTTLDGRFVIKRVLGSGGMGVVLAAQHLGLKRLVAVKILRPEFLRSSTVVHRFLREARAVATLKSEHVVDVLDAGTFSNRIPYFVMEHLSGIDLGAAVARYGPLDVDEVVHYALQTLEALAEAHRRGVVHRDLKPSNLFLTTREDDSGFIKVLDFGVSKLVDWAVTADGVITRQGTILGSPRYMSPEQIQDAGDVDARSDIWSFGTVLHELLTGRPPFDDDAIGLVIRAICTQRYELPDRTDLPVELTDILTRCLQRNRKERFQSVEALARAFQPLARTAAAQVSIDRILRTAGAPPPRSGDGRASQPSITPITADTPYPTYLTRRRRRRLVAASLGVGAALGAAFVLGKVVDDDPHPPVAPAAPVVTVTVTRPAPAVPHSPVATVQPEPPKVATTPAPRRAKPVSNDEEVSTPAPPAPPPKPAAKSYSVGEMPAAPVPRVRPIDTENPFRK